MMRRSLFFLANFVPIFMPALSPSMDTGTVVEWKKKVGDLVKENDVFCSIQTDKAVVDYTNTFEAGYLAKIYCGNGSSAAVAKTIAVMVDDAADVAHADEYVPEDGAADDAAAAPANTATTASSTSTPAAGTSAATTTAAAAPATTAATATASHATTSEAPDDVNVMPIFMPALSPSMDTGTVVEWKKKVGDLVKENDVFCSIQTDKAVVDYTNTFEAGYLAKIYCGNGSSAAVAKTIAVMVSDAADVPKLANYRPDDAADDAAATTATTTTTTAAAAAPTTAAPTTTTAAGAAAPATALYGASVDAAVRASGPGVMRVAKSVPAELLQRVVPTGKGGRFVKADFAGQPGFDYATATAAASTTTAAAAKPSSTAAAKPPATGKTASTTASGGDVYDVVVQPGAVVKRVDDTQLLQRLLKSMPVARTASTATASNGKNKK